MLLSLLLLIFVTTEGVEVSDRAASRPGYFPPANCEPQPEVVELKTSNDAATFYYPSCTRIERCSGCCGHELMTCQPTRIENVTMKVLKVRHTTPPTRSDVSVTLEKHLECKCSCKTVQSDCSSKQQYRANECRCVCSNEDEAANCLGEDRFWDSRQCECVCRKQTECSTGSVFSHETCSCQAGSK